MIKFKSEALEPYHITSRELAHILGKKHNVVIDKARSYYTDAAEEDRIKTKYVDANNRLRTEFHMTINFAIKIILCFNDIPKDHPVVDFVKKMFISCDDDLKYKPDIQLYRPTPSCYKGIMKKNTLE